MNLNRMISTGDLKVIVSNDSESFNWNDFVKHNSKGSFYHLYEWKNIFEDTYGYKTHYFSIFKNEELIGVIPFVKMKNIVKSAYYISLPYLSYAGSLFKEGHYIDYLKIIEILDWKSKSIKIRAVSEDEPLENDYVTMILNLPENPEILWNGFKDKVRNLIRKSEKYNLKFVNDKNYLFNFLDVYYRNMKRLGTPVHRKDYYLNILKYFPGNTNVWVVLKDEIVIGGMLAFTWNKCTYDYIASTLVEYNSISANMFLYWNSLKSSIEQGSLYFDFGRSKFNSPTSKFKKQWGAYPKKLIYIDYKSGIMEKGKIPEHNKYTAKIWSNIPDILTRNLGYRLRKYIP